MWTLLASRCGRVGAVALFLTTFMAGACGGGNGPAGPSGTTLAVRSIAPATGAATGGTPVTIAGSGFAAGATVTIGGAAATSVAVTSAGTITAVTPAHAAGAADVAVASGGRTATLPGAFTFVTPSGSNQPPVVQSVTSTGPRANQPSGFADRGDLLTLTAAVTDAETPASDLTYTWQASQGTIAGAGRSVTWQAPASGTTPADVLVSVVATEQYTENGVVFTNTSAPGTLTISLHDSQQEILDMGQDFLVLFSQSQYSPDEVLHNFSKTCDGGRGYDSEYADVVRDRDQFVQQPGFSVDPIPPAAIDFGGTCIEPFPISGENSRAYAADACSSFNVHWIAKRIAVDPNDSSTYVGEIDDTTGVDYVTAVVEQNVWKLCNSDFDGKVSHPSLLSPAALFARLVPFGQGRQGRQGRRVRQVRAPMW
jgi:IPT/TIG domain